MSRRLDKTLVDYIVIAINPVLIMFTVGSLLYFKSSNSCKETEYVRSYRKDNADFPHESTADQFFDETRFEAYRALGYCIVNDAFSNPADLGPFAKLTDA